MPVLYQAVAKQTWLSQQVRNIFYYEVVAALSGAQAIELADGMRASWVDSLLAVNLDNSWSLNSIDLRRVDIAGLLGDEIPFTAGSLAGTSAVDPLITQAAFLVNGKGTTTRPNQVRSYLAGCVEGLIGSDAKFISALLVIGVDWADDMDSIALTGDTAVRQAAKWATPSATHVTDWNPLTSYLATSIPATQRKRRIGVGI